MALPYYDKGDQERISVTWRNDLGALTDPTTVALVVRKPDGTSATPTVTFEGAGTGTYHYDITWDQSGYWEWDWTASGSLVATERDAAWVGVTHF